MNNLPLTDGQRLAIRSSKYEPKSELYQSNGQGQQIVLERDPKRLYIEFRDVGGGTYPKVYPGGIPSGAVANTDDTSPRIYKSNDCPGLVAGEWYILSTDALAIVEIITDTYIGKE